MATSPCLCAAASTRSALPIIFAYAAFAVFSAFKTCEGLAFEIRENGHLRFAKIGRLYRFFRLQHLRGLRGCERWKFSRFSELEV